MIWGEDLNPKSVLMNPQLTLSLGVVGGGLGRPTPSPNTPGGSERTALVTKVST